LKKKVYTQRCGRRILKQEIGRFPGVEAHNMLGIMSTLKAATMGNPKKLRPMIIWTFIEYLFRGAPYGILLFVIWELFTYLENPGATLDTNLILMLTFGLVGSTIILFAVSKKAYNECYSRTYEICADGRLSIAKHLRKLPMGFYNARDPGDIGSYLLNDYANVEFLLSHLVPQIFGAVAMPFILLIVLATQNWQLALMAGLVIPLSLPTLYIIKKLIGYFGIKHQKARRNATSRMLEYLQGIRLIKAFNLTGTKFQRLEKSFRTLKSLSIKLEASAGPALLLPSLVLHFGFMIIILFGLTFIFAGSMPIIVYVTFLIIGSRVFEPLLQVYIFLAEMNYYKMSVDRIEELRKTPIMTGSNPDIKPKSYDIEFNNVTFRYQDTDVLKNVSTKIPQKSLVAIVGPSGSGKTTMTRLIARFWDVSDGAIKLGGNDIKTYDPDDVLSSVSMVFQDVYLFNDTILNNIKIGKKEAKMDEIINTAKAARCHDFIKTLPEGYDTLVGEGGSTLAGGEKQRISIARAMLKDSPIILLDEATASLDPENELYIQQAIDGLLQDKTVVIIAHRLNTVVNADKIIVLDKGQIIEEGNHDDLLKNKGLYYRMWNEQRKTHSWKF
jgi:ATP-binding cassette subfamily B protein